MDPAMAQQMMAQGGGAQGGMPNPEQVKAAEQQQAAAEEQRQVMLASILAPEARERLARIALVKPEKATALENQCIMMARRGQLMGKVSEAMLIQMIEGSEDAPGAGSAKTKVTIQRRRPNMFDDDDW